CGFFPNARRPSVFWIGVEHNPCLIKLKNDIDCVAGTLGLTVEKRKFYPHITLARISVKPDDKFLEVTKRWENFLFKFTVHSFKLMSGELRSEGALHKTIRSFLYV
nr:RNA 2',3'-cyclic phosphodiesterase [Victivallales bacterium]